MQPGFPGKGLPRGPARQNRGRWAEQWWYSQQGGPGGGTVAVLVGDQDLGREEGAAAGEADEEGPLQLLGCACWVLLFHVMLLELGVGKEMRQQAHCRAPRCPEGCGRGQGSPARVSRISPVPQDHDNN